MNLGRWLGWKFRFFAWMNVFAICFRGVCTTKLPHRGFRMNTQSLVSPTVSTHLPSCWTRPQGAETVAKPASFDASAKKHCRRRNAEGLAHFFFSGLGVVFGCGSLDGFGGFIVTAGPVCWNLMRRSVRMQI